MTITAYLAGPDVFLPDAVEHAARKVAICARFRVSRPAPLNQDVGTAAKELETWQAIFAKDIAMMEQSDIIIANLTPFGPMYRTLEGTEASGTIFNPKQKLYRISGIRRLMGDQTWWTLQLPKTLDPKWIERAEYTFSEAALVILEDSQMIWALREPLYPPDRERQTNSGTLFKTGLIEK